MTCRRFLLVFVAVAFASAGTVYAQPVLLQIRPHVGDTLEVRLDQRVDMTGRPAGCVAVSPSPRRNPADKPRARLCSETTRHMATAMEVFSRAMVRKTSADGADVLAVTDSIRTASGTGASRNLIPRRQPGSTSTIEMRLATDGGAEVVGSEASEELRTVFGQIPAMLPRRAVSVGEQWRRQMRVPVAGETGAMGLVRATFQLDSLGNHGDVAFISMRGTLSRDHRDGSDSELSGSMSGAIQLDRRLAWITETRAVIDITSTLIPIGTAQPMRVRTVVTQHLRAGRSR